MPGGTPFSFKSEMVVVVGTCTYDFLKMALPSRISVVVSEDYQSDSDGDGMDSSKIINRVRKTVMEMVGSVWGVPVFRLWIRIQLYALR